MGKHSVPKDQRAKHVADCLAAMSDGGTVRQYAMQHGLTRPTLMRWLSEDVDADTYARARDAQADATFEELEELARSAIGIPAEQVQGYRLAVDTLKWKAAKLAARYADRQEMGAAGGVSVVRVEIVRE